MIEIRHRETGLVLHRVPGEDLTRTRLRALKLAGADLHGADLREARLSGTDLSGANLEGAKMNAIRGTEPLPVYQTLVGWLGVPFALIMAGAVLLSLISLDLEGLTAANGAGLLLCPSLLVGYCVLVARARVFPQPGSSMKLRGANLAGANLNAALLHSADLEDADLRGATLDRADLRGAVLCRANLEHASLAGCSLSGADLRNTNLHGACLVGAGLFRADLQSANLQNADLSRAELLYTDLSGADLRGADLRTHLSTAKLKGARYDETTRWPAGFQPSRHGCVVPTEAVPATAPVGRGDEITVAGLPSEGRDEDERGQDGR
jgi:uncharacterized protein YjbI with pentapeptide repeats